MEPKSDNQTAEESTDIMDSLDNELQSLSKKDNADWNKFTPLATGVGNCVFIGTTVSCFCLLTQQLIYFLLYC